MTEHTADGQVSEVPKSCTSLNNKAHKGGRTMEQALCRTSCRPAPKYNILTTPSLINPTTTEPEPVVSVESGSQARQDPTKKARQSHISAGTSLQSDTDQSHLGSLEYESHFCAFNHGDVQLHKKPLLNVPAVRSGGCIRKGTECIRKATRLKMLDMNQVQSGNIVRTRGSVPSSTQNSKHNPDPAGEPWSRNLEQGDDAGAIPELEKDHFMIVDAATVLVMLSLCKNQSSSSLAGVCRRPISSSKAAGRLAGGTNAGQEINSHQGCEAASPANPEDATASCVLSRPSKKRRYRLMLDLLAKTPRLSADSENQCNYSV